MYKLTLPNGQTVEVSKETYDKVIEEADESKYYNSESKGKMKLVDMADEHLKNAILKTYKLDVLEKLNDLKTKNLKEVQQNLSYIMVKNSDTLDKLLTEAKRRNSFFRLTPYNGTATLKIKHRKFPSW